MNNPLRILAVLIGGILVAATYTFPLWQPYLALIPGRGETAFLGLPAELSEQITRLPESQVIALRALAEETPDKARTIAIAQLTPGTAIDEEEPQELGQQRIILGDLTPAASIVQAQGTMTIYETANGGHILRFDDLNVTNLDGMSIYLTGQFSPTNREELEQGDNFYRLIELRGNAGNQNYAIAVDVDLSVYNSVVIYSEALDIVVGYADFRVRL